MILSSKNIRDIREHLREYYSGNLWIRELEGDQGRDGLQALKKICKQIMGVRWWRKQCEERAEWKKITEKAKTHSVL
jgi:hypothetical protein